MGADPAGISPRTGRGASTVAASMVAMVDAATASRECNLGAALLADDNLNILTLLARAYFSGGARP